MYLLQETQHPGGMVIVISTGGRTPHVLLAHVIPYYINSYIAKYKACVQAVGGCPRGCPRECPVKCLDSFVRMRSRDL